jgi:hypothetical protein
MSPRALGLACLTLLSIAIAAPTAPAIAAPQAEAAAVAEPVVSSAVVVSPAAATVADAPSAEEAQVSEGATRKAVKLAERRKRLAEQHARKLAEREARQKARLNESHSRDHVKLSVTCQQISVTYSGFNDLPGNTVTEVITVDAQHVMTRTFTFDGPTGTDTFPFTSPAHKGLFHVDVRGHWSTNGIKGGYDLPVKEICKPAPAFTVQKLQSIAGSGLEGTSETLTGLVGQTVDYKILLTNTGNTPLMFAQFLDPRCDPGTVTRSTQVEVPVGGTMTFECTHVLTPADQTAGSVQNVASVTGTPPGELATKPVTHESNTVVVSPVTSSIPAGPGEEPKTPPAGEVLGTKTSSEANSKTTTTPTGKSGTTGVLGFSSATVPALKGPQGCVRGPFHASIKSKGVSSVSFYVDGHRVKTLTSKSSRGGLLSVSIDVSKLAIGPHKVMAKITMKASSTTAKAAKASRSLTVVHCASAVLTPRFTG